MSGTRSIRLADFDIWRAGYAGANVRVLVAGTSTLAQVFSDPELATPAANPQVLAGRTDANGVAYGRWPAPLYVGVPYQLRINDADMTGVARPPFYGLAGVEAGEAVVTSPRAGAVPRQLRAWMDETISASSFGTLGVTAAANNAILTAAIGAAGTQGGGDVLLPPGSYPFISLTLPANVRLAGAGRGVTTLRSEQAAPVITLGGNAAGLRDLTLDGMSLQAGSTGLLSVGRNEIFLSNVEIKRFDTGILVRGGANARFRDLILANCSRAARLRGDLNIGGGGGGGALRDLDWLGGAVALNLVAGLELVCEDAAVEGASVQNVLFDSNTGDALLLTGARSSKFTSCRWLANTTNMRVADGAAAGAAFNTVRSLAVDACMFSSGELRWDGRCEGVIYSGCTFAGASFIASVPANPIVLQDCRQDASTLATGAVERIMRSAAGRQGSFSVQTSDATPTMAWQFDLAPGEVARITARVVGRQVNGVNTASYGFEGVVTRPAATINYASASSPLAAGATVTGTTSGATAIVSAVSGTTSGTLTLRSIVGAFQSGEGLVFSGGQSASATGSLVTSNAALAGVAATGFQHETDADWDATLDASGSQARVIVTGAAGATVQWDVQVQMTLGGLN